MKILLITLEYPPQKGGVASYYEGLVGELKRQGHSVEVVNKRLLWRWIWPRWLRGYFTVRAVIKTQKPDLIFVGHILPLSTIAYLLCRRAPYVVFTHGMDVLMAQKSWRKRWLAQRILQHAKLVVTNSEFTAQVVRTQLKLSFVKHKAKLWSVTKIAVVYPCPNISPVVRQGEVELLRQKLGLTGKRVLLTLGRVVERKGHDLVLRALPEILTHVPNVVYVVAGDGPDLARLQKMVADAHPLLTSPIKGEEIIWHSPPLVGGVRGGGLQSYVRFVGAVSDEERPLYYALCDIFIMPSRQIGPVRARVRLRRTTSNGIKPDVEGFGLSFLEAALFGKPSVGGQSGGVPEAIVDGQTGVLVDPNDAGALARAVVQLLRDDNLRERFGQAARGRALKEFTWENQIKILASML